MCLSKGCKFEGFLGNCNRPENEKCPMWETLKDNVEEPMKVYGVFNGNDTYCDNSLEGLFKTQKGAIECVKEMIGEIKYEVLLGSTMRFYLLDHSGKKTPSYFNVEELEVE